MSNNFCERCCVQYGWYGVSNCQVSLQLGQVGDARVLGTHLLNVIIQRHSADVSLFCSLLQRSIVTPAEQWLGARAAPLQEQCREPIGRILCAIDAEVDTQIVCPLVDKATEFIWRMPGAKLISGLGSKACNITGMRDCARLPAQPRSDKDVHVVT